MNISPTLRRDIMLRMRAAGVPDRLIGEVFAKPDGTPISRARIGQIVGVHTGQEADQVARDQLVAQVKEMAEQGKSPLFVKGELRITDRQLSGICNRLGGRRTVFQKSRQCAFQETEAALRQYVDETGLPITFNGLVAFFSTPDNPSAGYNLYAKANRRMSMAQWRERFGQANAKLYNRIVRQG